MSIRNSAKAIIIQDGYLLTIKKQESNDTYYVVPGGGQEQGENLHETVIRECKEELGADVEVGELLFVREYIGKNHQFAEKHALAHQTEFLFLCQTKQQSFHEGTNLDDHQIGTEWLPIKGLLDYNLYPQVLRSQIAAFYEGKKHTVYLGDIN
jgi:8-oxo-dGTP diphosphatase